MSKIKEFYKKHKEAIIVGGIAVVSFGVTVMVLKQMPKKQIDKYAGKSVISWKPNGKIFNLEEVKQVLDANAESSAMYAIFREGVKPDEYTLIRLNDSKML